MLSNIRTNAELYATKEELLVKSKAIIADIKQLEEEITAGNKDAIEKQYALLAKQHGTVKMDAGAPGIQVAAEIKKTVKWDQPKLRAIMAEMTWERIQALFKIEVEMGEKIYNDIADQELKKKLMDAREVVYSEVKINLVGPKAEA